MFAASDGGATKTAVLSVNFDSGAKLATGSNPGFLIAAGRAPKVATVP